MTDHANPAVMQFLATRRSFPRPALLDPAPEGAELDAMLEAALRVPDHGRLEPWRLILIPRTAQARLGGLARDAALNAGRDAEGAEKAAKSWNSPLIVAVIFAPVASPKIPRWEQYLSAGAVCLSLVNAALAAGWGATWLTGAAAEDAGFIRDGLGLAEGESVAGFVHIGSRGEAAPTERPRPDLAAKLTWL